MKKKWKKTKSQSAKSKKHESKITGGKRENQKGKIGKQWIVHLHCFLQYFAFSIFFFGFLLHVFFPG
jgi:hypothetical protein